MKKMRRRKSWGETHFLSPVWIREKNTKKNLFNITFFTRLKKIEKLIDYKY